MLVDAENGWRRRRSSFGCFSSKKVLEQALDGRTGDVLSSTQPAAIDAIPVFDEDAAAKWLGRPFPRQYPRKPLPEVPLAALAVPFAGFQFDDCSPLSPTL